MVLLQLPFRLKFANSRRKCKLALLPIGRLPAGALTISGPSVTI
jgi:hypothetical protein